MKKTIGLFTLIGNGNWLFFAEMVCISLILGISQTGLVLINQKLIIVTVQTPLFMLLTLIAAYVLLQAWSEVGNSVIYLLSIKVQNKIMSKLYQVLGKKVSKLSLNMFDNDAFLNELSMAKKGINEKVYQLISKVFNLLRSATTFTSISILIFTMQPFYLIWLIIMCVLRNSFVYLYTIDTVKLFRHQERKWRVDAYYKSLFENKQSLKEIKIYQIKDWLEEKRITNFKILMKMHTRFSLKWSCINTVCALLMFAMEGGYYILLIYQLYKGKIDFSGLIFLFQAQEVMCSSVFAVYELISGIKEDFTYIKSFYLICDMPEYNPKYLDLNDNDYSIKIKQLNFGYKQDKVVLKDVSFYLKKNEILAIVGQNGSGKSTLVKLITGMMPYTGGDIYADSTKFSTVFQDYGKYALSLKENIIIGNIDHFSSLALTNVFSITQNNDLLKAMPDGLQTFLDNQYEKTGINLSDGQWQNIAIMRALYSDSNTIIFDEPTASLDPIAEKRFFEKLKNAFSDRNIIIITHRIGLARIADNILCLKDGIVLEQGTHEELIGLGGYYKKIYLEQARWYLD